MSRRARIKPTTPPATDAELRATLEDLFHAPADAVVAAIAADPDVVKAVRGGVAEHLATAQLRTEEGVVAVERVDGRHADRVVTLADGTVVRVEVKTVDAATYADGTPKVDLRRSNGERLYRPDDFEVVGACLVTVTGRWEYRYRATALLDTRTTDDGVRLDPNVKVTGDWAATLAGALADVDSVGRTRAAQALAAATRQPSLFD